MERDGARNLDHQGQLHVVSARGLRVRRGDESLPLIEAQSLQQVLDRNQSVLDQELNFITEGVATPERGSVSVSQH
jgi:hypothetical protein